MDIMEKLESYEFIFFLNWLVDEKDFDAKAIIDVVEKPFKYQELFNEYRRNK